MTAAAPLLEISNLAVRYRTGGFARPGHDRPMVRAVDDVSFALHAGETLGVVGESGCGKSTLARAILRLEPIAGGSIRLDGREMASAQGAEIAWLRARTAMIFQDPYNALNPRMSVGETLGEVVRVHRKAASLENRTRVLDLMALVGLGPELVDRKPRSLSGGQCQRVGIARALALEPELVIADECVAALDVSIQGQIINLLIDLKAKMRLALIFIAHDLTVVRRLCDRVAVMYLGRIVEIGSTEEIFTRPKHPYTRALIRAIPEMDPNRPLFQELLPGEPPSPIRTPAGCAFHPRCPEVMQICRDGPPPILSTAEDRNVACHRFPGAGVP
ncbi:ABC transporter ATP-binding protein [Dongia sedimenti]|uniref:ABC transporter ATP-binding protein n=1 Tax=Dongia sedimenti TaxID=3064282 RepID=A0ABU0YEN6_9PROT|nr:ABC transporter ATP-binding protein [Rhodospirillaceae bacterium R-7]